MLLLLVPRVKGGFLAQPEAVEERTAHQGEGVLDLGDQGGALRLSGDRGERLGFFPGLLYHIEIQLQRDLRVQAQQLMLTGQMAAYSRGVAALPEQAAQQRKGVA